MLYGFNWVYKYFAQPGYIDVNSWISGVMNVLFFFDFLGFKLCGTSPISRFVIHVDDGVTEVRKEVRVLVQSAVPRMLSPGARQPSLPHRNGYSFEFKRRSLSNRNCKETKSKLNEMNISGPKYISPMRNPTRIDPRSISNRPTLADRTEINARTRVARPF